MCVRMHAVCACVRACMCACVRVRVCVSGGGGGGGATCCTSNQLADSRIRAIHAFTRRLTHSCACHDANDTCHILIRLMCLHSTHVYYVNILIYVYLLINICKCVYKPIY